LLKKQGLIIGKATLQAKPKIIIIIINKAVECGSFFSIFISLLNSIADKVMDVNDSIVHIATIHRNSGFSIGFFSMKKNMPNKKAIRK